MRTFPGKMAAPEQLFVWEGDSGLPSVDCDCLSVLAYAQFSGAPLKVHKISNPWRSPSGSLPAFRTNQSETLTRPNDIIIHLRKQKYNADYDLSAKEGADSLAFTSLIHEKLRPALMTPHDTVGPKWLTEDGFEMQIAVNHLGHFLLTNQLLPLLRSSAPSRIINVSSIAHKGGEVDVNDLFFCRRSYSPLKSYRQSKLANVLFTRELSRREKGSGVSCFCLHPGVIRTELGRHVESSFPLLALLLSFPALLFMKTPHEGSQTTVYCAVTPGLESKSGKYFSDCAEKETAAEGRDDETALKLWNESCRLVGLDQD